ncbi:MAG: alcohol dehydrogenase [Pedobacter sp.]|jgi:threonine dehydrogenase-like Zn-dependent dehydrogenase|nr:alcohol dehydrogenase [Pedobacter sp.]
MKAIALEPGTTNVYLADVEEPQITAEDEVKIKVWQVGICGTDREEAGGGRADAPENKKELIIGHEMFGQVVEVGASVKAVMVGDYGVFTVRRGCGQCDACKSNRSDMCYTGEYTERGIKGADGFQCEYVVDKEQYLIPVPEQIKDYGVLTEPMSVAAKAIDEALNIQQARLKDIITTENWLEGKRVLVAGIGAIGLLAAFALRLKGAEVFGMDIVPEDSLRPQLLQAIGGQYINGNDIDVMDIDDVYGECDFIFESAGIAKLQINLIDGLGINGIYVTTGIPSGERPELIMAAEIIQQMVLKNQVVLGSVNASPEHYRMAVDYLKAAVDTWPEQMKQVITEKVPYKDFGKILHQHSNEEIKVVVDWL